MIVVSVPLNLLCSLFVCALIFVQSGVKDVPAELLQLAMACDVITFGSPSAVKAWVALVGLQVCESDAAGIMCQRFTL